MAFFSTNNKSLFVLKPLQKCRGFFVIFVNLDMGDFNKNDKQVVFNKVIGVIHEIELGDRFSNLTLIVGHENLRHVNLCMKSELFSIAIKEYKIGDKVIVTYYISSIKKHSRWYTTATLLTIDKTM